MDSSGSNAFGDRLLIGVLSRVPPRVGERSGPSRAESCSTRMRSVSFTSRQVLVESCSSVKSLFCRVWSVYHLSPAIIVCSLPRCMNHSFHASFHME